ncbi:hypothetical protein DEU56DRAFT_903069 [Suillus clintonianus]|uniref:uncharacterized protein n=1 Tax=Suillus clintonianus TaxID=1904413 RepID=UPI001B867696|nr:uncharacterized protein DEU56DRAFT_903069 [Suillus clintonianus]KAG2128565.1 hypothetical protein DEU56DRAFT_903069 [Suillus clintonianus]
MYIESQQRINLIAWVTSESTRETIIPTLDFQKPPNLLRSLSPGQSQLSPLKPKANEDVVEVAETLYNTMEIDEPNQEDILIQLLFANRRTNLHVMQACLNQTTPHDRDEVTEMSKDKKFLDILKENIDSYGDKVTEWQATNPDDQGVLTYCLQALTEYIKCTVNIFLENVQKLLVLGHLCDFIAIMWSRLIEASLHNTEICPSIECI